MAIKKYYKLNGNANDYSGNGYNGTANVVTYVAGPYGQAASFNGTSSYIDAHAGVFNAGANPYSFFGLVNTANTDKFSPCESNGSGVRRFMCMTTRAALHGMSEIADGTLDYGSVSTTAKSNIWHSVAFTMYNTSVSNTVAWCDGDGEVATPAAATHNINGFEKFTIGSIFNWSSGSRQNYWTGKICHARWETTQMSRQYVKTLTSFYRGIF